MNKKYIYILIVSLILIVGGLIIYRVIYGTNKDRIDRSAIESTARDFMMAYGNWDSTEVNTKSYEESFAAFLSDSLKKSFQNNPAALGDDAREFSKLKTVFLMESLTISAINTSEEWAEVRIGGTYSSESKFEKTARKTEFTIRLISEDGKWLVDGFKENYGTPPTNPTIDYVP